MSLNWHIFCILLSPRYDIDIRSRSKHPWCWPVYLLRHLTLWRDWMFCICTRQVICTHWIWCMLAGRNFNTRKTNECNDTKDIHQNIEGAEVWIIWKDTRYSLRFINRLLNLLCKLLMDMRIHCPYRCLILICPWGNQKYFLSRSSVMAYRFLRDVGQEM